MNLYYLWNKLHKLFVYIICIEKFFTIIFGGINNEKQKDAIFIVNDIFYIYFRIID